MVRQKKLSWKVWPTRLPAAIEPPAISLWDSLSVSARRYPVLVVMQNCPQLVIAHYAIARANAVVVPVNPMNRAEELRHYITDAQATIAITTGDLAGEVAAASNGK